MSEKDFKVPMQISARLPPKRLAKWALMPLMQPLSLSLRPAIKNP
jgi:hypothetical protein